MDEKKSSYLEKKTEAAMMKDDNGHLFVFQRAKLSMQDPLELQLIHEADDALQKHIEVTEDEVQIRVNPPASFFVFSKAKDKNPLSRWLSSYQILKKIRNHELSRLQLVVCPENIVFDSSLAPYFLHYGVKDSLPPYEHNQDELFKETKATISALVDGQYTFEEYLLYHKTLKLSSESQSILAAGTWDELSMVIQNRIEDLEKEEKSFVHIPEKKWKMGRYTLWGTMIVLVPLLLFTIYTLFFSQPKQDAYVDSGESFLKQKYSEVIDRLENYDPKKMPYVVQYELAKSYVAYEPLDGVRKKNVENAITLQTDSQYLLYWIYIGRGMSEDAIDLARIMEDRELIMYGLVNLKEQIKLDDNLSGEEKETQIKEVDTELSQYEKELKELKKQLEEQQGENQPSTESNLEDKGETEAKPAVKEEAENEPASGEKEESKDSSNKSSEEKEKSKE
ncbi:MULTISPECIES: type VII secretion protein EssB [Peribacillus]|uniref:type VII secretion protein EssB n=1 Tax=Peribacillus TaxID=2675229 RepID=UPI001F4E692F|nr:MULTISPECIES: type VII secretion protein EssB [unclassified Peribacillus]MCK1986208.1 type VII secretion protein EssB [Peribacillus sp. Aquil_B1]MCK2011161.1 type VII secretion protein EssB [Peribacillus sp. Aquil_B8]